MPNRERSRAISQQRALLLPVPVSVFIMLLALNAILGVAEEQQPSSQQRPITLAGCLDKCGNINIPFPFGIEPGCFLEGFQVTCNYSFQPPRLFIFNGTSKPFQLQAVGYFRSDDDWDLQETNSLPVELMDISVAQSEARAYGNVRSDCRVNRTGHIRRVQLTDLTASPFLLAATRNVLVGVGWDADVDMRASLFTSGTTIECASQLMWDARLAANGSCTGLGCCQTIVSPTLWLKARTMFNVGFKYPVYSYGSLETYPCSYGMIVESSWYNFSTEDMSGFDVLSSKFARGVPFVIDFAIRNGSCPVAGGPATPEDYACRSGNSSCANATNGPGYICKCWEHYDGNPYIPHGCQDIDECALRDQYPYLQNVYPCSKNGKCVNKLGGYDCPCRPGMKGDGKNGTCTEIFPLPAKVAVGIVGVLLAVAIVVSLIVIRIEKIRMKDFFEKNGGPLLENVNNIKIFKKEELKPILKGCNIVGKGAFGEVYKGILSDNQLVAVKKSISVSAGQKEQFANEVIIQSRIIHKNIVKLIGCCLEVDIPMLVYEFISKGSLHDILHDQDMVPFSLGLRLRIAAEAAEGLAYMHSTATILHGDVKPSNILLDNEFVPKISDFGISRLIAIDKEQYTKYVIGDRSYMDPVYLQTGILTKKSDVYSFGVVLLELISRKEATYADNNSLVMNFLDAQKTKRRPTEMFDNEIAAPGNMELLDCVVGIAVDCLNLDVDQRPEMTQVAERLLMLKRSHGN